MIRVWSLLLTLGKRSDAAATSIAMTDVIRLIVSHAAEVRGMTYPIIVKYWKKPVCQNLSPRSQVSTYHRTISSAPVTLLSSKTTYLRLHDLSNCQSTQGGKALDHDSGRADMQKHPPVVWLRIRFTGSFLHHRVGRVH